MVFMELCFSVVFAFTCILEHSEHLKEKLQNFSLKNVMLTLSEQEPVSCCLSCVAPQEESTLKWDKGFIVSP